MASAWLHQLLQVLTGEIGVDVEPEVRRFDGDLRVQPGGVHRVHHRHVVSGHGSGVLDADYVLPEMREDGSDPELFLARAAVSASSSRSPGMNADTERRTNVVFVAWSRSHALVDAASSSLRARDTVAGRGGRLRRPYSTPNASSTLPPEAPALIA